MLALVRIHQSTARPVVNGDDYRVVSPRPTVSMCCVSKIIYSRAAEWGFVLQDAVSIGAHSGEFSVYWP